LNLYLSKEKKILDNLNKKENIKNRNYKKELQDLNNKFKIMKNILNTLMKKRFNKKIFNKNIMLLNKN